MRDMSAEDWLNKTINKEKQTRTHYFDITPLDIIATLGWIGVEIAWL